MRKTVVAAAIGAMMTSTVAVPPQAMSAAMNDPGCGPQWTVNTVAGGFGAPLSNLTFDGRGGLLVSKPLSIGANQAGVDRISPDGGVKPLFTVNGAGAMYTRGNTVYLNTGLTVASALLGLTDGTIDAYNLDTGQRSTWATGLTAPDGMTMLPNGDAVTSTPAGPKAGLTLVRHQDLHHPIAYPLPEGESISIPNGLAVSNDRQTLYAVGSFSLTGGSIHQLDLNNPARALPIIPVKAPYLGTEIDDLTIGTDGKLYVAGTLRHLGSVYQIDPASGTTCLIASGVSLASSVRFGAGPGWDTHSLYSTGFDGTVRRITPPA